jgi:hypothetical protein
MRKFKKTFKDNFFPLLIFTLLVIFFFAPLFYPQPKILSTPDFGHSDVWHFNYPLKDFLGQSLKKHQVPLWNKDIGMGQPLLAEGQIGTFFIPNLLLFYLLPTHIAFNLGLFLIVFLAGSGTYLYCRAIKLAKLVSLFGAIVFGFNGLLIVQFNHFNLAQSASLLPFLFFFSHLIIIKKRPVYILPLALVLNQQIFTGFPQITFISLVGIFLYFLFFSLSKAKKKIRNVKAYNFKPTLFFALALLLAVLLSAVQLLPSYELKNLTSRKNDLSFSVVTQYPYPLKNFITFIFPYFFGNPAKGTYPLQLTTWGLFWENTAYVGIIPLVLFFLGIFMCKKRLKNFYFLMLLLSILLAPGKNSPVYLLYFLRPFNFFRIPSRFLLLTTWSIVIASCLALPNLQNSINKKVGKYATHIFTLIVLFLSALQLFHFGRNYHPYVNLNDWQNPPETSTFLKNKEGRIYSVKPEVSWNQIFTNGWQDMKPYLHVRNSLDPNLNLLFHLPQASAYIAMKPLRSQVVDTAIKEAEFDEEHFTSFNLGALRLLSLQNVKYIICPCEIKNENVIKVFETKALEKPIYRIYENQNVLPRVFLATNSKKISTFEEFLRLLDEEKFDPRETVLLEKEFSLPEPGINHPLSSSHIKILKDEHTEVILKVSSTQDAFLVVTDSYYPGWEASVDGKKQEILAANINQRAIFLEKGDHQVKFKFSPRSFKYGAVISVTTFLIIIFLILARLVFSLSRKFPHKI